VGETDIPTPDVHGLINYQVKAEGLTEMTVTTRRLLPPITDEEVSPSYRLVRMWDVRLIPPEDPLQTLEAEDEAEERNEEPGKPSSWLARSKILLSDSVDAVTNAVSQNSVVMFFTCDSHIRVVIIVDNVKVIGDEGGSGTS
jgi:hypothetical protein